MKEVVVLSGKGGTGKTSIVGSLAAITQSKVLADCDVDAADLHLLLQPVTQQKHEFWSGQVAVIDEEKCTQCGLCQEVCRFDAINDFRVDSIACEGCGFCFHICPDEAIIMQENLSGHWFISETKYGHLVHARVGIAQENWWHWSDNRLGYLQKSKASIILLVMGRPVSAVRLSRPYPERTWLFWLLSLRYRGYMT